MRFSRLVIGVLVICAALWVIISEQMAGASADAVLNAQIVTVRTPIAGTLRESDRALGSAISDGDTLGTVVASTPDSVRLDDLILERDLLQARLRELAAHKETAEIEADRLAARLTFYRELSVQELSMRLAEARERLRLRAESADDPIGASLAREEVERLRIQLAGAEEGVFILGGFNDAPQSEQRGGDIRQTIAALEREIDTITANLAALHRRIDQERIRVGRMGTATLFAPVSGIIWERMAVTGSHLERGDPVLRLVDCGNVFVTLSVTQSVFNRLKPGMNATFRFDGSGEVFSGTVGRLGGTSAAGFYSSLAIAPSQRHLERADVLLFVPDLARYPEVRCAIGRTGRAFFETRPLDWLRDYFR